MSVKPFKDYPRRCFYINRAEEARPEEYIGFRRKLTGKRKTIGRIFGEHAGYDTAASPTRLEPTGKRTEECRWSDQSLCLCSSFLSVQENFIFGEDGNL